jgi:predicted nucleic acid-binding protein
MTIADSDVLIDYLTGRNPGAGAVARHLETGSLCTTAINRFEILSGVRNRKEATSAGKLLKALKTFPLDEAAADQAADVRRALERKGVGIGMADSLIAGIAVLHKGKLLTRNRRHFERVPGLPLADVS